MDYPTLLMAGKIGLAAVPFLTVLVLLWQRGRKDPGSAEYGMVLDGLALMGGFAASCVLFGAIA